MASTGEIRGNGIADKAIFIFELVTDGGVRPTALDVVALIVEAGAVEIDYGLKRRVDGAEGSVLGRNAAVRIDRLQVVLEAGEAMRPVGSRLDDQVETREQIVLPRFSAEVGRENVSRAVDIKYILSVEVPGPGTPVTLLSCRTRRRSETC